MSRFLLLISFISTSALCDPEYIDRTKLTERELATLNGEIPYADFSDTIVTANWNMGEDGIYVYTYNLNSKASNIGKIVHFTIDITCKYLAEESFGYRAASNSLNNKKYFQYGTENNAHDNANRPTYSHHASWWPFLKPGETMGEFQIFSEESPVYRKYELGPSWDDGDLMPSGSQYKDYTVNGRVLAPGCNHQNMLNDRNTPDNIEKRRVQSLIEKKQSEEKRRKANMHQKPIMCVGAECF